MTITAKYAGKCSVCGGAIHVGSKIEWAKGAGSKHAGCAGGTVSAPAYRSAYRGRLGSGAGSAPNVRGYSSYCTDRSGCRCYDCAS